MKCFFLLTCFLLAALSPRASSAEPVVLNLWPDGAPQGEGEPMESVEVKLSVHLPDAEKRNGTAVVICPGGGYGGLVTEGEGHGIARWLNAHGITGAVLEYRLPRQRRMVPLSDAQRALQTLRSRATEWNLDPAHLGIMGFSAGGHLAASATVHFVSGDPAAAAGSAARESSRPDFAVLIYPVITMKQATHGGSRNNLLGPDPKPEWLEYFSLETQVTASTPPVYLAHALDDTVVTIENSRGLHRALKEKGIPTELLELATGGHGLNGYKGPSWDRWQTESLAWLGSRGVPVKPRQ